MIPPLLYQRVLGPTLMQEKEVSQPPIAILPLDFEMTDSTAPILYLSSSMGSIYWDSLDVSYCDSVEPYLMKTSVSTSVDVTSTSHRPNYFNDAHVNLVSHEYA